MMQWGRVQNIFSNRLAETLEELCTTGRFYFLQKPATSLQPLSNLVTIESEEPHGPDRSHHRTCDVAYGGFN